MERGQQVCSLPIHGKLVFFLSPFRLRSTFSISSKTKQAIPTTYALNERTILILAGGSAGPPLGLVTVPGKPSKVFHVSAVLLSRVPSARIWACALLHRVFAAALAWQTLVSWSQILLVMMSVSTLVSFLVSRVLKSDIGGWGRTY
jgi:hypothetical protein